jgi:hypothetical protein
VGLPIVSQIADATRHRVETDRPRTIGSSAGQTSTPDAAPTLSDPENQTIAKIIRSEFFADLSSDEFAATPPQVKRVAKRIADALIPIVAEHNGLTLVCYSDDDGAEMIFESKSIGKRVTYMIRPDGEHVTTYFSGGASMPPRAGKAAFLPFAFDATWLIDPTGSRKLSAS